MVETTIEKDTCVCCSCGCCWRLLQYHTFTRRWNMCNILWILPNKTHYLFYCIISSRTCNGCSSGWTVGMMWLGSKSGSYCMDGNCIAASSLPSLLLVVVEEGRKSLIIPKKRIDNNSLLPPPTSSHHNHSRQAPYRQALHGLSIYQQPYYHYHLQY